MITSCASPALATGTVFPSPGGISTIGADPTSCVSCGVPEEPQPVKLNAAEAENISAIVLKCVYFMIYFSLKIYKIRQLSTYLNRHQHFVLCSQTLYHHTKRHNL